MRKAEFYKSEFALGIVYEEVFDHGDDTLNQQNLIKLSENILYELKLLLFDIVVTF